MDTETQTIDRKTVVAALAAALTGQHAADTEKGGLVIDAHQADPHMADTAIPLAVAAGDAALWIERLDGRILDARPDAMARAERLARAEPLIMAVETALGMEFAPAPAFELTPASACLEVVGRDASGHPVASLRLALSDSILESLATRETGAAAVGRHLPVVVTLELILPPVAATAGTGDVLLIGDAPPTTIHAPSPLGQICQGNHDGAEAAARFRSEELRYSAAALEAAKRGDALPLTDGLSGTVHLPGGRILAGDLIRVGSTRAVCVGKPVGAQKDPAREVA